MAASAAQRSLEDVQTPAFVVWRGVVKRNCEAMAARAKALGVALRPHVKTHKVLEVAAMVQEAADAAGVSITGVVASTVAEVEFFAKGGHKDITYAVPFDTSRLDRFRAVRSDFPDCTLRLLLDNAAALTRLEAAAQEGEDKWATFVKVDCGYARAGVSPVTTPEAALGLVTAVHESPACTLTGLYSHSGNSYNTQTGAVGAAEVASGEGDVISAFAAKVKAAGIPLQAVGVGSTPAAVTVKELPEGVTEMHPGNFVFYDLQQVDSGSCTSKDVACAVVSRVIGVYPERNEVLIDAGGTAVHKDPGGVLGWGAILGHKDLLVLRMSQECAVVGLAKGAATDTATPLAARFGLGDIVHVLPNHSCMSACQHAEYLVAEEPGNTEIVDTWVPCKFW